MSNRKILVAVAGLAAIVVTVLLLQFQPLDSEDASYRVITLYADKLQFNASNPTFTVKVGETVRIRIVNLDDVPHDFAIKELPGASTRVLQKGETQTITVRFDRAGIFTYTCTLHPVLMDGTIIVVE